MPKDNSCSNTMESLFNIILMNIFFVGTTAFIPATDYISSKYFDYYLMQCPTALALNYELRAVASAIPSGVGVDTRAKLQTACIPLFALLWFRTGGARVAKQKNPNDTSSPPYHPLLQSQLINITSLDYITSHIHRYDIITAVVLSLETNSQMVVDGYREFLTDCNWSREMLGHRFHTERLWCTLDHVCVCCGEV